MDTKREFLALALHEGANRRELCRRFGISPKTGYALLRRHAQEGLACCQSRSTRPHTSPTRSAATMEAAVVAMRQRHPCWGGRKIARALANAGHTDVPAPSTVTGILHRHGLVSVQASQAATPWQRFEHETPNALWQIDFKGHFDTQAGPCHPLTLLDDHSRYNLTLSGCTRENTSNVQAHVQRVFERYGLPVRINGDNGPPWGCPNGADHSLTKFGIWLIRLGVSVSHSTAYHPQTNGKLERFHESLKAEVLNGRSFASLAQAQTAFDHWRSVYNHERPHESLGMLTPDQRYQVSPRVFPGVLAPIEYGPNDIVIEVGWNGIIKFQGRKLRTSTALHRLPVALRADTQRDGCYDVYFCHQRFMRLDMNALTALDH